MAKDSSINVELLSGSVVLGLDGGGLIQRYLR